MTVPARQRTQDSRHPSSSTGRSVTVVSFAPDWAADAHSGSSPASPTALLGLAEALRSLGASLAAVLCGPAPGLAAGRAKAARRAALAAWGTATDGNARLVDAGPSDRALRKAGGRLAKALRPGDDAGTLLCVGAEAGLVGAAALGTSRDPSGTGPPLAVWLDRLDAAALLRERGLSPGEPEASTPDVAALRAREAEVCAAAPLVIATNRPLARELRRRHDLSPRQVAVLPRPVAVPEGGLLEARRTAARSALGIPPDDVVFAVDAGRDGAPGREALLVHAVAQSMPEARLLVATASKGRAARAAVRAAKAAGVARPIVVRPLVEVRGEPPAPIWAAADVGLVLPETHVATRTSCPAAFGEMLAWGARPVLTPGVGDVDEFVTAAGLGALVSPSNVLDAARAVVSDLRTPGALGDAGRERRRAWAAAHLSFDLIAERLAELLGTL